MKNAPSRFLRHSFPGLHTDPSVVHRANRHDEAVNGPDETVSAFIGELEAHQNPETWKRYLGRFVVKSVTENYIQNERRRLVELGYGGDIAFGEGKLSEQQYGAILGSVREDQKERLDDWVNYFAENNADYPAWFIYFATRSIVGLSEFDIKTKKLPKRTSDTVANFPELDQEALSMVYEQMVKELDDDATDKDIKTLAAMGFGKMYASAIAELGEQTRNLEQGTEGKWVKYHGVTQGEDLAGSLKGKRTGWCTASVTTATNQLNKGDFYVYYTYGTTRQADIPRVAIRTERHQAGMHVVEVRGVDAGQALENDFLEIASEKLTTIPGGELYDKKVSDMQKLTSIQKKIETEELLEPHELIFLYEVTSTIQGFGQKRDPRIQQCLAGRDRRSDYEAIALAMEDVPIKQDEIKKMVIWGALPRVVVIDGSFDTAKLGTIRSLPAMITASRSVRIASGGYDVPLSIKAGNNITLQHVKWTELPRLEFSGSLSIHNVPVESLPSGLVVNGTLRLNGTKIAELPEGLVVTEGLRWRTDLAIPFSLNGAQINGSIDISKSSFTSLPDNLHVKGDLDIRETPIETLPSGLIVEGNLKLRGSKVSEIPSDIIVKGNIIVDSDHILTGFETNGARVHSSGGAYNRIVQEDGAVRHIFKGKQVFNLENSNFTPGDIIEVNSSLGLQNGTLPENKVRADYLTLDKIAVPAGIRIAARTLSVVSRGPRSSKFPTSRTTTEALPDDYDLTAGYIGADIVTAKSMLANAEDIRVIGNTDLSIPGYSLTRLPRLFIEEGSLSLYGIDLSRLSSDSIVSVGRDLDIRGSNLRLLPQGWQVGGDVISDTPISRESYPQIAGEILIKRLSSE